MIRDISTLTVGTRFYNLNGDWEGYIVNWGGVKGVYIPYAPDSIPMPIPFENTPEGNCLDIALYDEENEEWDDEYEHRRENSKGRRLLY